MIKKQKLVDHFNRYKSTDVVYVSGDTLFLTNSAAMSYGNGKVEKVTRAEVFANNEGKNTPSNDGGSSKPVQTLTEEALKDMSYNDMKSYVKEKKIDVVDMKKETLIAVLSALIKKED